MKKAMIAIAGEMEKRGMKSKMILQVHDELIFEAVNEEKDELETLIREKMEGCVTLPVPLRVSVESGLSWGDMHL